MPQFDPKTAKLYREEKKKTPIKFDPNTAKLYDETISDKADIEGIFSQENLDEQTKPVTNLPFTEARPDSETAARLAVEGKVPDKIEGIENIKPIKQQKPLELPPTPTIGEYKPTSEAETLDEDERMKEQARAYTILQRALNDNLNVTQAEKSFRTPGQELAGSYASGLVSTPLGILRAAESIGINSAKPLADKLDELNQYLTPNEMDFMHEALSGLGSFQSFFIPGKGVYVASQAIGKISPKIAKWFAAGASGGLEASVEAGFVYDEVLKDTGDKAKAQKAASKTFLVNSILVPLTNKLGIFGDEAKAWKRALESVGTEGLQEASQEIVSSVAAEKPINWENVLTSAGIGGLLGGGAGFIGIEDAPEGNLLNQDLPEDEYLKRLNKIVLESQNPENAQYGVVPFDKNKPQNLGIYEPQEVPGIQPPAEGQTEQPSAETFERFKVDNLLAPNAEQQTSDLPTLEELRLEKQGIKKPKKLNEEEDATYQDIEKQFKQKKRKKRVFDVDEIKNSIDDFTDNEVKNKLNNLILEIEKHNKKAYGDSRLTLEKLSQRKYGTRNLNSLSEEQQQQLFNEYNSMKQQGIDEFYQPETVKLKNRRKLPPKEEYLKYNNNKKPPVSPPPSPASGEVLIKGAGTSPQEDKLIDLPEQSLPPDNVLGTIEAKPVEVESKKLTETEKAQKPKPEETTKPKAEATKKTEEDWEKKLKTKALSYDSADDFYNAMNNAPDKELEEYGFKITKNGVEHKNKIDLFELYDKAHFDKYKSEVTKDYKGEGITLTHPSGQTAKVQMENRANWKTPIAVEINKAIENMFGEYTKNKSNDNFAELERKKDEQKSAETKPAEPKVEVESKPVEKTQQETIAKPVKKETGGLKKSKRIEVYDVPLSQISVDTKKFQGRKNSFSEDSVQRIIKAVEKGTFNYEEFDPILLWSRPDGGHTVLSGHSRLEAWNRLSKNNPEFSAIPAKLIEGKTIEEAEAIAKRSNVLGTRETPIERAAYYREKRKQGVDKRALEDEANRMEGTGAGKKILMLSYLDPDGTTLQTLSDMQRSGSSDFNIIDKIANFIGDIRSRYPQLTDAHEEELYKWLYNDGLIDFYKNKVDFINTVSSFIEKDTFNPNELLGIRKNKVIKSSETTKLESELKELVKQRAAIEKQRADFQAGKELLPIGLTPQEYLFELSQKIAKIDAQIIEVTAEKRKSAEADLQKYKYQEDLFSQTFENETMVDNEKARELIERTNPEELEKYAEDIESKERNKENLTDKEEEEIVNNVESLFQKDVDLNKIPDKKAKRSEPGQPIKDFGEKIGGARKDDYNKKLTDSLTLDLANEPLSKTFPEPNYQQLLKSGVDFKVVTWVRMLRDIIPTKPQRGLKRWVEQVTQLREIARSLLDGRLSIDEFLIGIKDDYTLNSYRYVAELYEMYGHDTSLKGIYVKNYFVQNRDENGNPTGNVEKWAIIRQGKQNKFGHLNSYLVTGPTKQEVFEQFATVLELAKDKKNTKSNFIIYHYKSKPGVYWIGKKVGKRTVDLKSFGTSKEAQDYLANHIEELDKIYETLTFIPHERPDENRERTGPDWRNGKNITPDEFIEAFGFRGVEFGNYVSKTGERQAALNKAYDALKDLSSILGIPSQAISLNGQLGLAFGARGSGGKNAPSAHYELDKVVINLTKKHGAGSLAHEWFHALDNYFSRKGRLPLQHITENLYEKRTTDWVRTDVIKAFQDLMKAIENTEMGERAKNLDKAKAQPYWSKNTELAARAMENYVIEKLRQKGYTNDYLASIKKHTDFLDEILRHLGREEGLPDEETTNLYPYLTEAEFPGVVDAFDKLFATLETVKKDDKVGFYEPHAVYAPKDFNPNLKDMDKAESVRQKFGEDLKDEALAERVFDAYSKIIIPPRGKATVLSNVGNREITVDLHKTEKGTILKAYDRDYPQSGDFVGSAKHKRGKQYLSNLIDEALKNGETLLSYKPVLGEPKYDYDTNRKREIFSSYGAKIKGNKVVLYHGTNKKFKPKNLLYNSYLSSSPGMKGITGNAGAAMYGDIVHKYELPIDQVEVTSSGEFIFKGNPPTGEGFYPAKLYQAYQDYYGTDFTKAEMDNEDPRRFRMIASIALEGGTQEFDAIMNGQDTNVKEKGELFDNRTEIQKLQDEKRHLELSLEELERIKKLPPIDRSKYPPKYLRDVDNKYKESEIKAELLKVNRAISRLNAKLEVKKLTGQFDIFGREQGPEQGSLFEPTTEYSDSPAEIQKVFDDQLGFDFTEDNSKNYVDNDGDTIRHTTRHRNSNNPSYRPLQEGEYAAIERKYRFYHNLKFFGKNEQVKSPEDVAYIFRQLENESIEHVFTLHIDVNGNARIQHIATGTFDQSPSDTRAIIDFAERFNTKEIYFVHNHPSGNIVSSLNDRDALRGLRKAAKANVIVHDGIIIDTFRNKYGVFGEARDTASGDIKGEDLIPIKSYSFTRQSYKDTDYDKNLVRGPQDIAAHLTGIRFNAGRKFMLLSLTPSNRIVGRFYLTNTQNSKAMADEIAALVMRSGGVKAILAGNRIIERGDSDLTGIVNNLVHKKIPLLDYIAVHPSSRNTYEAYFSAVQSNIMPGSRVEEPNANYEINEPSNDFTVNEPDSDYGNKDEIFYSKVEQIINTKAPAKNIKFEDLWREVKYKDKNGNKQTRYEGLLGAMGAKLEEVEYLGLEKFLTDNPNATKSELLEHIRTNTVIIEEILKGQSTPKMIDEALRQKNLILQNDINRLQKDKEYKALEKILSGLKHELNTFDGFDRFTERALYLKSKFESYRSNYSEEDKHLVSYLSSKLSNFWENTVIDRSQTPEEVNNIVGKWAEDATKNKLPEDSLTYIIPVYRIYLVEKIRDTKKAMKNLAEGLESDEMEKLNQIIEGTPTLYSTYTLPGGANYRELLLRLPEKRIDKNKNVEIKWKALEEGTDPYEFETEMNKLDSDYPVWGYTGTRAFAHQKSPFKSWKGTLPDGDIITINETPRKEAFEAYNEVFQEIKQAVKEKYPDMGREEIKKIYETADYLFQNSLDKTDRPTKKEWTYLENMIGDKVDLNKIYEVYTFFPNQFRVNNLDNSKLYYQHLDEAMSRASKYHTNTISVDKKYFVSKHWSDRNILGHLRFSDRIKAGSENGRAERVLYLDEIQSDWHEIGREKGYQKPFDASLPDKKKKAFREFWDYAGPLIKRYKVDDLYNLRKILEADENSEETKKYFELENKYETLSTQLKQQETNSAKIPDAPFKNSWHELLIKRMIRFAAENGYDRIAWTTGEIQTKRYKLSNFVDKITVREERILLEANKNSYLISGYKGGKEIISKEVGADKLHDTLGKDLANKIISDFAEGNTDNEPGMPKRKSYEGKDLEIGGQGMKYFYDVLIPSFVKKYAKKWKAEVEEIEIERGHGYDIVADSINGETYYEIRKDDGLITYSRYDNEYDDYIEEYARFDTREEAETVMEELIMNDAETSEDYDTEYTVWSLPITNSMKEEVLDKGQVLFEPQASYEANTPVINEDEKKKLYLAVLKQYGQFTLNSPELGEYRNKELKTVDVIKRLKDANKLELAKEFNERLIHFKLSPRETGEHFELVARILLREVEQGKENLLVSEEPGQYNKDPKIQKGLEFYKAVVDELGEGADYYPKWVKLMAAEFGEDVRKGIRGIWRQVRGTKPTEQVELFMTNKKGEQIPERQKDLFVENEALKTSKEIGLDKEKIAKKTKEFKQINKVEGVDKIKELIFQRRANTEVANFKTSLFVHGIENSMINGKRISKEQMEVIPFLIEETPIPKELNRPELEAIYNDKKQRDQLILIADQVQGHFDSMWEKIVRNTDKLSVEQIENYVTHIWDIPKNKISSVSNWFTTKNKFLNKRYITTLAEGIKEFGLKPKMLNIADIIKVHDGIANRVIENNKFINSLKHLSKSGLPIILRSDKAPTDYVNLDHPALTATIGITDKEKKTTKLIKLPYLVHPDLASSLEVVFGKRIEHKFINVWEKIDAVLKKTALSISLFHHGALLETGIAKTNPFNVMKLLAKETISKGLKEKFGESPLLSYPDMTIDALKHGVQFGHSIDIDVHGIQKTLDDLVRKTQDKRIIGTAAKVLKTFNEKWDAQLWDYMHDPLKLYAYMDAKTKMPIGADPEIYLREQAQLINDTYGGQNWDVLMVSPKTQQLLRWFLLSPDWTISTVRQALAITGFGAKSSEGRAIRAKSGTIFWLKAGLYFGVGINLLNMFYRRRDKEENPEYYKDQEMEFMDYTMWGNTVGHKTHLFTGRYEDGSERYTRWGKQFRELPELIMDEDGISFPKPFIKKIGGKTAPLVQLSSKIFTGKSPSGYEEWNLKDKVGWDYTVGILETTGMAVLPFSSSSIFRDDKEWYPIDLVMPSSKGMTKTKAIKLFMNGIIYGDIQQIKEIYSGAVRNGLDAYGLFVTALTNVKAEGTRELFKDIKTVEDAERAINTKASEPEKEKIKRRIERIKAEESAKKMGMKRLNEAIRKVEDFKNPTPKKKGIKSNKLGKNLKKLK